VHFGTMDGTQGRTAAARNAGIEILKALDTVVAVDISSSGVRARAHGRDMRVYAERAVDLDTYVAADGTSTHDLTAVLEAVRRVVRAIAEDAELRVVALSASGTASSLAVARLENGIPQGTAVLLWSDTRAASTYPRIAAQMAESYERTLCPPDVSYWPAKLRYLADQAMLGEGNSIAGAKDFVFSWLTGQLWTDPMTAASTGVFDSVNWRWDEELLYGIGVSSDQLPEVRGAAEWAPLTVAAAIELGLPVGLPVAVGGMDGPLTQLGSAGTREGVASCTIGTSIAFREGSAQRAIDPQARTWCYPVSRDFWVIGGAGSNGGNLLTWLRDRVGLAESISELVDRAFAAAPDSSLTFVPYLHGERAPLWRSDLRAAFIGLSAHHTSDDLSRAVLEGIAASVLELAESVESVAGVARQVVFTGGFLRDRRWVQLMTDALGVATSVPVPDVATSTGTAMVGWAAVEGVSIGAVFEPGRESLAEPDDQVHQRVRVCAERIGGLRRALWP
jgi:gluconokinase